MTIILQKNKGIFHPLAPKGEGEKDTYLQKMSLVQIGAAPSKNKGKAYGQMPALRTSL